VPSRNSSRLPARRRRPDGELTAGERIARIVALLLLLAVFLAAIDVLGEGIAALGGGAAEGLFTGVAHPLAGLSVGILGTVLVQSSSVTTATIVALVGAHAVSVEDAVPMVMGANIGTSITNTLAALGSIRRSAEFRRAFAGATMHDFFNAFAVLVLLPLEIATGLLGRMAVALSAPLQGAEGGELHSPVEAALGWLPDLVRSGVDLVTPSATVAGIVLIALGLATLMVTLVAITKIMRVVIAGAAERSLNRVLGRSGALGIVIGALLTVAVQSSSITTSLLIPMIAAGVLTIENGYPVTLGANIGTTVTALIASLAVPQIEGLQIALVHLLFNATGTLLFYPVPALRRLPLGAARRLADLAVERRAWVAAYIIGVFVVLPLVGTLVFR